MKNSDENSRVFNNTTKVISIITPVYNRARLIKRLYTSLINQNYYVFQWIIVDDGSSDNIDDVVSDFRTNDKVSIIYLKQKNQGKCAALKNAIAVCETELFLVVDSDDYLNKNAIKPIVDFWDKIRHNNDFIGIASYRFFANGKISGKEFPENLEKSTLNRLNYHYRRHGELSLTFRTEMFKKVPFDLYEGEKFLSEEILYNKCDEIGYLYLLRENTTVMEYQTDGLTNNYMKLWVNNPKGTIALMNSKYNHVIELNVYDVFIKRIKTILQYDILRGYNASEFTWGKSPNAFLSILLYLPALILKRII